jgi:protein involved in polysaccharide export with SLBB domain
MGEVRAPGIYSTDIAADVVSAMMAAGGPGPDAKLSGVTLTRRNGDHTRSLELDMGGYLDGTVSTANMALRPGDTVNIPSRSSGLLHGLLPFNTIMPVLQVIISTVIAVESIRVARGNN